VLQWQLAGGLARAHGCCKYIFAGDITGYGYDAKTALAIVRENFDIVLMGNHDSACVGLESGWAVMTNPNYDLDRMQRESLSRDEVEWIRHLPYEYANRCFAVAHGDFVRPRLWNYILSTEVAVQNFFACPKRVMFCGHTHHSMIWEATEKGIFRQKLAKRFDRPAITHESISFKLGSGRYIVNVGSVGYPRHDLCASYAIYDSKAESVTIRRLPFDFESYISEMLARKLELPMWLCDLLEKAHRLNRSNHA
jgi:predicted phosphodiesterase